MGNSSRMTYAISGNVISTNSSSRLNGVNGGTPYSSKPHGMHCLNSSIIPLIASSMAPRVSFV